MTDSEIVKDFETEIQKSQNINIGVFWSALDLINRLTEKSATYKVKAINYKKEINRLQDENRKLKAEQGILLHTTVSAYSADETIKELQAKVERRDKLLKEVLKGKINIKAEAYKEFADMVKESIPNNFDLWRGASIHFQINNFLKELVGEDDA